MASTIPASKARAPSQVARSDKDDLKERPDCELWTAEEWCSGSGGDFLCNMKNMTTGEEQLQLTACISWPELPNGNLYSGSTSRALLPHGLGVELSAGDTVYSGQWWGGRRSGLGTLYYPSSHQPEYVGQFRR